MDRDTKHMRQLWWLAFWAISAFAVLANIAYSQTDKTIGNRAQDQSLKLQINDAGTKKDVVEVQDDGIVKIGSEAITQTPTAKGLYINTDSTHKGRIRFGLADPAATGSSSNLGYEAIGGGQAAWCNRFEGGGDTNFIQFGYGAFSSGTCATPVMTVSQSSEVGIGTTTPQGRLHLNTGAGTAITPNTGADELVVQNNTNAGDFAGISIFGGTTGLSNLYLASAGNPFRGYVQYQHNEDRMDIGAGSVDRVTIEGATGHVGINDTNPSAQLDVIRSDKGSAVAYTLTRVRGKNTNNDMSILKDSFYVGGNSATALYDLSGGGLDSGFSSIFFVHSYCVGINGDYAQSEGVASTYGSPTTNQIRNAMANLYGSTITAPALSWSGSNTTSTLTITTDANTASCLVEVKVVQRKVNAVTKLVD